MARTVLLADDSVTAQNMGRRILTDAGYEVITVNNGSAALKKIHENKPDLIVLDVYMPGYGGLEVCQRLKEAEATARIPVLLTVGKMEPFKTDEAKRVRADGHIVKPFDASELLAALTRLEDRIVPQSEAGKGRAGKSDAKKSRRLKDEEITGESDEARNDRISYLEEMKKRHAKSPKELEAEAAASGQPLTGIERKTLAEEETPEEAVTFAAGPVPAPSAWPASQNAAPEFPIEKEAVSEPAKEEIVAPPAAQAKVAEAQANETKTEAAADRRPETANAENAASKPAETVAAVVPTEPEPKVQIESTPRWVAENVALSAEEASRSLDDEMRQAQTVTAPAPVQSAEKSETPVDAVAERSNEPTAKAEENSQPAPEAENTGSAFAAAAGASASSTQAVSPSSSEAPAANSEADARENWERVGDTVIGEHAAAAIAKSVAAMAENVSALNDATQTGSESQPATTETSSAKPTTASDPLSNIVDNVLAELKPRLLAEIAKQLATDKK